MARRGTGTWARRALIALACAGLTLLHACTVHRSWIESTAQMTVESRLAPDAAATLTAWPTAPAVVTRPPTLTPAPQPLWTSAPRYENPPTDPLLTPGAPLSHDDSLPYPVRILIPALNLDVAVIEIGWTITHESGSWRSEWESPDRAAGHLRGSANPGEAGNMVIAGHHNTKGEVFRPLSNVGLPGNPLQQGDDVIVVAEDGREYLYRVAMWFRFVEEGASPEEIEQHARYLDPTDTGTLTLVTCWPYESNTHRVLVIASLVP